MNKFVKLLLALLASFALVLGMSTTAHAATSYTGTKACASNTVVFAATSTTPGSYLQIVIRDPNNYYKGTRSTTGGGTLYFDSNIRAAKAEISSAGLYRWYWFCG